MTDKLNKNIRFLRRQAGLTQQALADRLGIKRSLLGAYEEGRARPNLGVQLAMTRQFGISLDSLVRNDLELTGAQSSPASAPAPAGGLLAGSTRVLSIVVDDRDEEQIVLVQEKARAGYALGYADPEFVAELPRLQLPFLPAGTYRAFEISGDSMLPLQPGSIVVGEYVSDMDRLQDGQTYVLLTQSEGMVYKRVFVQAASPGHLVLQSDNAAYAPYELPTEELLEAWEAKLFIGRVSRRADQNIDQMMSMLGRLQQQIQTLQAPGRSGKQS
jgi:transcriptional regulator with XRE-family HTH domain